MYSITRRIEIDAGHRVMTHGSKCANFHGHRYVVLATAGAGYLHSSGDQKDMVIDFGFMKGVMMQHIHDPCDHAMILCADDPWRFSFFESISVCDEVTNRVKTEGAMAIDSGVSKGRLYIVPFIPTAEKLAEHWFHRMQKGVVEASRGIATLLHVEVYETPNCVARFPREA